MSNAAYILDHDTPPSPSHKAHYQDLFLRSIDSILLVDMQTGVILEANDASEKVFRLATSTLVGRDIHEFCPAHVLGEFKKMLRIASRRYHPKTFELALSVGPAVLSPLNRDPQHIEAEMAASPLKLVDGTEVLQLIFRDVTQEKENERKIQEYIAQIETANKMLEEMATTDGMTGLTNFRQFSKLLEAEHARAERYHSKYTILFCDIDHFKKYNDANGHPAGDALLKEYAALLKSSARTTDVVARYGGEEFIILCPETDLDQGALLAERIRETIQNTPFANREKQPLGFVSCSIGVSNYPKCGTTKESVVKAADDVLYESKQGGRNRVSIAKLLST